MDRQAPAAAHNMDTPVGLVAATRRRTLARLRAVTWLALLLPALAFALVAAWLYREAFADARRDLDRAVHIAQEHALKLFDTNEMLLQRMLDLLGDDRDDAVLGRSAELHQRLQRMSAGLPQVQGLFMHGADGRSLATSRVHPPPRHIDYTDREWYVAHRAGRGPVFVTEQLTSRATGEPFFDMSRRRDFADGSFAGTVNVSLRPEYLTRFWQQLAQADPNLRFALLRADGKLVARWPGGTPPGGRVPPEHPLMRALAGSATAGSLERAVSPFDQVERMTAFRRLDEYPLVITASITRSAVVAAWQRHIALLALFVLPLALGFAAMAWLAQRRTREELDAVQRLDDETARRQRIELALLQSQKLEALGRLTGGVAHDFNNLLMVVGSNLHLLRRLAPDVADSAQLAAIERAVAAGAKLTRQLLAFARRQALRPERIDLHERMPALLQLLRPLLGQSIELTGTVEPGTAAIEVDPAELELALINLAVNAKDAMPGGGRLEVSARNADAGEAPEPAHQFVVIEVADSGGGVDPALLDRVFDAFFTTKPVGYGTGLGLSQVQALAASAGGVARIDNRPGGGARVRLYLRRAAAAAAAPGDAADAGAALPLLHCRLLLVEDNDAVAQAIAELLQGLGCSVQRVADAGAALAAADRDPAIDLVLSDIEMPGAFDGIALAAQLRARRPQLPVLLMTGYAARLEQAVRQQLDVLPKPCSPAMLASAIGKALALREHRPAAPAHEEAPLQ